jgi:hypothetical protein
MTFDELIKTLVDHKYEVTTAPGKSPVNLPFKERFLIRQQLFTLAHAYCTDIEIREACDLTCTMCEGKGYIGLPIPGNECVECRGTGRKYEP